MPHPVDVTIVLKTLLTARPHVGVAHHIPGRIRLRFETLPLLRAFDGRVDEVRRCFEGVRGVTGFSVNHAARSAVITYDPAVLAPQRWETLLRGAPEQLADLIPRLVVGADPSRPSPQET